MMKALEKKKKKSQRRAYEDFSETAALKTMRRG
jgi:hypothetical protein